MQTVLQIHEEPAARRAVLVPYPVDKAYDYATAADDLQPGDYVTVPLGPREVPGVVWKEGDEKVSSSKLKPVLARHDISPMPPAHRKFIEWVAHYTMAPLGAVLKLSLSVPAALAPEKPATGYVAGLRAEKVNPKQQRVL